MQGSIQEIVLVLVPMILSLTVHEWAHAWTAFKLGDNTAERQGRLTLNPISHIDPVGTLLLPAFLVLSGTGMFFGWAKPVPISPSQFSRTIRMKTGVVLTAAAGPISNLILALLMAIIFKVMSVAQYNDPAVIQFVSYMFLINIVLAVFNLIPVPPLDGNRVVVGLLPDRMEQKYYRFLGENPYVVPIAFVAIIAWGGDVIQWPISVIAQGLMAVTGN